MTKIARTADTAAYETRIKWFREARLGMFIHWGLYSLLGRGEWVMFNEAIPPEDYAPLADRFRPRRFDPAVWAELAEQAGAKYVVFTARHHDGFSLWDSQASDFTSTRTAAGRDFVADYVAAVRKAGLKVGLYYSLADWRFPAFRKGPQTDPAGWKALVDYVHVQVEELMTGYGRIDMLFYDGAWPYTAEDWRAADLNAMVRRHQPHILINDRSGRPEDYGTPEQAVPVFPGRWGEHAPPRGGRPFEACMTLNDCWGYSAGDKNWKSTRQVLHTLLRCVSCGGNLLINIGPRADGSVPAASVRRLGELGDWLRRNGQSIYGCGPTPTPAAGVGYFSSSGLATARDDTLYFHILRWPGRELWLPMGEFRVRSARMPATGRPLAVVRHGDRICLQNLPLRPPDDLDTVIEIQLAARAKRV